MITDFILNILFFIPYSMVRTMPEVNISIPDNVFNGIETFVCNVAYVFPIKMLLPIIFISVSVDVFNITWSLIIRIKSFIPSMGA